MSAPPLVSIIVATYNRSNVLALALRTALWQTVEDWELWVVGDACTDDSEDVVRSFGDQRLRFLNLERNAGEQSGPNNAGFARSKGRFIAYLGHDDLWFPDHLETALTALEETGAGWVFTLVDYRRGEDDPVLVGAAPGGRYALYVHTVPSSWVIRREVLERIGPWRAARACYASPQEELTRRAHRLGVELRLAPRLTVVKVPSGLRHHSYARRDDAEVRGIFEAMASEPGYRERALTRLALAHAAEQARPRPLSSHLVRAGKDLVRRAALRAGVHPYAVHNALRFRRRGGGVDRLRQVRGLPPLR